MRFVDVYQRGTSGTIFVCAGCIQLGEPMVQRSPIVHSFTLADGSPVVYPAPKDTATMTVELECTKYQAMQLERLVHGAQVILTGLKFGALQANEQAGGTYPEAFGYDCLITGAVEIGERYAGSGIYSVTLPVQFAVSTSGAAEIVDVPTVRVKSLTLGGTEDTVRLGERYVYQPRDASFGNVTAGIFVRQGIWFTQEDTLTFSYEKRDADAEKDIRARVWLNGKLEKDCLLPDEQMELPLLPGENQLGLHCLAYDDDGVMINGRPLSLRLCIYRQAVKV